MTRGMSKPSHLHAMPTKLPMNSTEPLMSKFLVPCESKYRPEKVEHRKMRKVCTEEIQLVVSAMYSGESHPTHAISDSEYPAS